MTFSSPLAFLLIIPYLGLLLFLWRRKRSQALGFSSLDVVMKCPKGWRSHLIWLPTLLLLLSLLLFIIVLARPQHIKEHVSNEVEGISIQLVLDVSSSMETSIPFGEEFLERIEVAKMVLSDFVLGNGKDLLGRPNDLIGLLSFARYTDTICPLTFSHKSLVYLTQQLNCDTRPNEDGTGFGDAVALAAARLRKLESTDTKYLTKTKIIILLSDGENNCGKYLPEAAGKLAKKWGVKVYAISLGAPEVERKLVKTSTGHEVKIAKEFSAGNKQLIKISEITGGIFRTAHDYDSLAKIYSEIDELEKTQVNKNSFITFEEAFQNYLLWAIILMVMAIFLQNSVLRRMS